MNLTFMYYMYIWNKQLELEQLELELEPNLHDKNHCLVVLMNYMET